MAVRERGSVTAQALGLAAVLLLGAAPGPSVAADGPGSQDFAVEAPPELRDGLPVALFEETIHAAYDALREYTAAAGAEVRFEARNLETHPEAALGGLRMADVATMPEGRLIQVHRASRSSLDGSGEVTHEVEYRARWITQEAAWRGTAEMMAGIDSPLNEMLGPLAEGDERFRRLAAVTTYDVTATLGEESRSYSASFFWFRDPEAPDWSRFDLLVMDHVTQGVESALRETVPVDSKIGLDP